MCAILLVAGCVSNKAFKEQRDKAVILEQRQNKQDTELEILRKDLLKEKENIQQIVIRLNDIDQELLVIDDIQAELAATGEDIYMLEDEVLMLKEELADAMDRSTAIEQSIADLRTETTAEMAAMRDSVSDEMDMMYMSFTEEIDMLAADTDDSFDAVAEELDNISYAMGDYVTQDDLVYTMEDYVTQDDLDYALEDYVTRDEIANLKLKTNDNIPENDYDDYNYMMRRLQGDVDNLRDVVTDLQSDVYGSGLVGSDQLEAKMNQEAENRRDQLTQLRGRVDDLEMEIRGRIESETGVRDESLSGLTKRLNIVERDLEDLRNEMGSLSSQHQVDIEDIKDQMDRIATQLQDINSDINPVLAQERQKRAKAQELAAAAQYKASLAQYNYGNYEEAIIMFEDFIADYPYSELIPNAWYWIGECYYAGKKWPSAVKHFEYVADNFSGHKANDARLKMAMCYYYMGRPDDAYDELMTLKNMTPRYEHMDLVNKFLRLISY
jgi:TolA-binding protein